MNSNIIITISYLIVNCFTAYIISRFYNLFLKERLSGRRDFIMSFIAFFIINSLIHLIFNIPLLTLITNIILYFLLTFNYHTKLSTRIFISFCAFGLLAAAELIVTFTSSSIIIRLSSDEIRAIWLLIFSNIIAYISLLIIRNYKTSKQNHEIRGKHSLLIIFIACLILSLAYCLPLLNIENSIHLVIGTMVIGIISVFLFIFVEVINKANEEEFKRIIFESKTESYKGELLTLKNYQKEIKNIKHDIDNHLQSIRIMLLDKNYTNAIDYIEQLIPDFEIKSTPVQTGSIELDSILNAKINQALDNNIIVTKHFTIKDECKIDSTDLISVIGNLMNNAIEAVAKIHEVEKRKISLTIGLVKGVLFIEVVNPYIDEIVFTDKREVIPITSKKDINNHGYGIPQIYNIVEKYNGFFNIKTQYKGNKIFRISVTLDNIIA